MERSRNQREHDEPDLESLAVRLRALSDADFLAVFRAVCTRQQFNYPDTTVLDDRDLSVTVLLADFPDEIVTIALDERTATGQPVAERETLDEGD